MVKGKMTMVITIGIACFVLITVMTMQFKLVNETDITSIENLREAELKTELANWKTKYDETSSKYEETEQKLKEYEDKQKSNNESSDLIKDELEQTKTVLGLTDVEGEGIVITLKDNGMDDMSVIKDDELILIVNALKIAGAEAISINDQRIVNMSDITYINSMYIKINGQRILAPYIIKVIGNQSYLESALIGNGGQVDELKKLGHEVSIEKQSNLKIDKYNQEIKTKYIE